MVAGPSVWVFVNGRKAPGSARIAGLKPPDNLAAMDALSRSIYEMAAAAACGDVTLPAI